MEVAVASEEFESGLDEGLRIERDPAKEIGYGWAFGMHEALDQFGALFGPLAVAAMLVWRGEYRFTFAALLLPAVLCLVLLLVLAGFIHIQKRWSAKCLT
jgi:hypothetical protein